MVAGSASLGRPMRASVRSAQWTNGSPSGCETPVAAIRLLTHLNGDDTAAESLFATGERVAALLATLRP